MPFFGLPGWNRLRRQYSPVKKRAARTLTTEQSMLDFFNSYAKPSKELTPISKRYNRSEAAERRLRGERTTTQPQDPTLAFRSSDPITDSELSAAGYGMSTLPVGEQSTELTIPSSSPPLPPSTTVKNRYKTTQPETSSPLFETELDSEPFTDPTETSIGMTEQRNSSPTPEPVRAVRSSTSQFLRVTERVVDSVNDSAVLNWALETPVLVLDDATPQGLLFDEGIDDSEQNGDDSGIGELDLPVIMPGELANDEASTAAGDMSIANDQHSIVHDSMREGTISIPSTPQIIRPLPIPPRPFAEHPDRVPQINCLNHPLHGFKHSSEEFEASEHMVNYPNDLKWTMRLDEATHEGDVCDVKGWDPEDERRELKNITVTWRAGLMIEMLERLLEYSNGNNAATRDCVDELYAENALLKRRVVQLEKAMEEGPSNVEALTNKITVLEAKLDAVLNKNMHDAASTRMAEKSIDCISKAMKPTIASLAKAKPRASKPPRVAAPKALHVPKQRVARQPLEQVKESDPLRNRIVSIKAPKMLTEAISFEAPAPIPGNDEEVENDLDAFNQYRNIMRLGRLSSDANLFHVDNPEQAQTVHANQEEDVVEEQDQSELVRVISGFFGTPGRVMMEKVVDENALDGSEYF